MREVALQRLNARCGFLRQRALRLERVLQRRESLGLVIENTPELSGGSVTLGDGGLHGNHPGIPVSRMPTCVPRSLSRLSNLVAHARDVGLELAELHVCGCGRAVSLLGPPLGEDTLLTLPRANCTRRLGICAMSGDVVSRGGRCRTRGGHLVLSAVEVGTQTRYFALTFFGQRPRLRGICLRCAQGSRVILSVCLDALDLGF